MTAPNSVPVIACNANERRPRISGPKAVLRGNECCARWLVQSGFLHRNATFGAYVDRMLAACTASGPIWPGHLRLAASPALAAAVMADPSPGQGCGASELAQRLVGEGLQDALSPRRALHPLPAILSRPKIVQDLFFKQALLTWSA